MTGSPDPAELLGALRQAVGDCHVLTDPADLEPFCLDWRRRYRGQALAVVKPATAEETARVAALCYRAGIALVPQGGNTGLCGGATPIGGEVVVSMTRLNRIRAIDIANAAITAEAGCTLQQVQEHAEAAGALFPLSLAAEGTATIGGNLATNAGGVQVLRYGNTRNLCLGLEVVLPEGKIWNGLRSLRKDNTGYDLKHLFIGAEGSLGLITAAVLKLFPRPRQTATAWVGVADPAAAVRLFDFLRATAGERLTAFELIGRTGLDLVLRHLPDMRDPLAGAPEWQILLEATDTVAATGLDELLGSLLVRALAEGMISDGTLAHNQTQTDAMWRLRENLSEAQKIEGISIKHDISLPISRIPEFLERAGMELAREFPGIRIVCFGHLGDGNLHFNLSKPTAQDNAAFLGQSKAANRHVHDLVTQLGGSISAEHGLGQLKRDEIVRYKDPLEMELMRTVKRAFDPKGLMNPGKVL